MGETIVPLDGEFELEQAREWERRVFQRVCQAGQEEAAAYLERLDEALMRERPKEWRVVGFRMRRMVSRFGEVCLWRRMYRDRDGGYHFLLDEYLGLKAHQAASPEMQALCTMLSGGMSFRKAADFLGQWLAGLLAASTCWRLLQRTGQAAAEHAAEEVEAVFSWGEPVPQAGERCIERLYTEADGVYVRLQRQAETHLELQSAIAYEGWERLQVAREAYRLREKRVYCHVGDRSTFWEGVSLAWAHKWNLERVQEVILGGDGASWIRAGVEIFAGSSWQMDGFHLARACRQAWGGQAGKERYQTLRTGQALPPGSQPPPQREGKQARRAAEWIDKVAQQGWGLDWRIRQGLSLQAARGLGCMEGNQAQLLADRMKGKGRSWSPRGASHMAKVQELLTNGEVQRWCYRIRPPQQPRARHTRHPCSPKTAPSQWLEAAVPALYGPVPNAPWVQYLRELVHPPHLPN